MRRGYDAPPLCLESASGSVAANNRYSYDPYGELQAPNPAQPADTQLGTDAQDNPFRFEGFYYDSAVKTYDMRARQYRPDIGKFLTQDRFEAANGDFNLQADPLTQPPRIRHENFTGRLDGWPGW